MTQRNTPATASDLTQTSLEQMYIDVGRFVDDQNLPIVITPQKLIVPIESQHLARKARRTSLRVSAAPPPLLQGAARRS